MLKKIFILFFIFCCCLSQIHCFKKSENQLSVSLAAESTLPVENECLGIKNVFYWFLLSDVGKPLVIQDAFGRIRPGLATNWYLPSPQKICFVLDTKKSFSNTVPITASSVRNALKTAMQEYSDLLPDLKRNIRFVDSADEKELCMTFIGTASEIFKQLAMTFAAPVIKEKDLCYYAGDFRVGNGELIHRTTGKPLKLIPIRNKEERANFFERDGILLFQEVQMQPLPKVMQGGRDRNIKILSTRGDNRIIFLYFYHPLEKQAYACLREKLFHIEWPFTTAHRTNSFMPLHYLGKSARDFPSSTNEENNHSTLRNIDIMATDVYDNPETRKFFGDWFGQCNIQPTIHYYPKNQFGVNPILS